MTDPATKRDPMIHQTELFSDPCSDPAIERPAGDPPIWFGIAGWSYEDWIDVVYPRGTRDTLSFVAKYVDLLEINSSFYRPPTAKTAQAWTRGAKINPRLHFTAKVHQSFTHTPEPDFSNSHTFVDGLKPLADSGRLLTMLAQFRYDFADVPANRDRIRRIRDHCAPLGPMTTELRHRSWQAPEALQFLSGEQLSVANLDYPTSRDSFDLPLCKVGKLRYLRLHGRNRDAWFSQAGRNDTYNYLYSRDELDQIARRTAALAKESEGLIVVANNHFRGKEMVNILELKAKISGSPVSAPPLLKHHYPELRA